MDGTSESLAKLAMAQSGDLVWRAIIGLFLPMTTWMDILKAVRSIEDIDPNFKSSFVRNVACGDNTSFWHDPWCMNGMVLMKAFPRLNALENNKDCKVSDRDSSNNGIQGFLKRLVNEDVNNALLTCSCVLPVLRKVWSWRSLALSVSLPSFSIGNVACGNLIVSGDSAIAKILHGVFQIGIWVLWNWRNRVMNASLDKIDKVKVEDVTP
ncbi:hypothetical protein Tco_1497889 [Tanacetum coccineum]